MMRSREAGEIDLARAPSSTRASMRRAAAVAGAHAHDLGDRERESDA